MEIWSLQKRVINFYSKISMIRYALIDDDDDDDDG